MAPAIEYGMLYYIMNKEWNQVLCAYEDTTKVFGASRDDLSPPEAGMWRATRVPTTHGVSPWRFESMLTHQYLYILAEDIDPPQVLTGNLDTASTSETWMVEKTDDEPSSSVK